jgi:CubicO group peptidase (beta-lactamase class C family)
MTAKKNSLTVSRNDCGRAGGAVAASRLRHAISRFGVTGWGATCAIFLGSIALAATSVHAQTASSPLAIPLELGAIPPQDMIALAPGGIEKGIAALPAIVEDTMKRSGVPGLAVAVVHGGKTVFAQGFGVREIGKDAAVDPETVFQIASLSKPISGTVAAIEVTAGKVSWDDKVVRFLPSFALADPYVTANATIGDFFAHRSGLPLAAGDDLEDLGFDRSTIIERLRLLPLDPFRISYHYANFGITTGAEAVAAASGQTWEELAAKALFAPLGMASTSARHQEFLARKNRTVLHALEDGRFRALYDRNADAQSPAGGVSSNVVDLAEWLKLLLAGGKFGGTQMISAEALAPMLRAQAFSAPAPAPDARSGFYGYGFNVSVDADGRPMMSHSGAFSLGGATNMQMIPTADVAIVVLTNAGPVGAAETVSTQFMDFVRYGASTRDWFTLYHPLLLNYYDPAGDLVDAKPPAKPAAASAPAAYVGTYLNEYFGPARIDLDGQDLFFSAGPKAARLKLTPWTGDEFSVAPRGENQPFGSLSSVKFEVKDGKAVSFSVGYLDGNGMGTWHR